MELSDLYILFVAELEKERLENAELRKRIEDIMPGNGGQDASAKPIPRPKGTAGTNFSIQQEMGLMGSTKKYETYKGIQVSCPTCPQLLLGMLRHLRVPHSAIYGIWQ
jgi:hypothetical protein